MKGIDWESSRDVAVAAALLVVLTIGAQLVRLEWMDSGARWLVYNIIFGLLRTGALYWMLVRLWWLVRRDGGPAFMFAIAIACSLIGMLYSGLWGYVVAGIELQPLLDQIAFWIRVLGLVFFAAGLIGWNRLPRWAGGAALAYAAAVALVHVFDSRLPRAADRGLSWAWVAMVAVLGLLLLLQSGSEPRPIES